MKSIHFRLGTFYSIAWVPIDWKEGLGFYAAFNRSYHDEIETRNRKEIPFSLLRLPRGLLVAEGP